MLSKPIVEALPTETKSNSNELGCDSLLAVQKTVLPFRLERTVTCANLNTDAIPVIHVAIEGLHAAIAIYLPDLI
jgi:hypothetical protein